ncbi:putative helicase [Sphingomonas changbaiensis NBRC 104936]|uniref:Putative helicase n=1 Tax=Sphingomonas changbaiensis NBRC 104936 TaxID=1219043 RepID=A0A0E9MQV4_9SPHN|nr:helicase-related protein [Sphingomonas changbaiensis]GAO39914.1 putative helicase [Sphingomonas changbaiensis NBRC 104936]
MSSFASSPVAAVLGPTNTGKTHLAVERMCAHSSGMIGFPLRLLAREVYDRVVAIKGENQVALITGEEKIVPPHARWFLCTAESMPLDRDVAFVALDEAQLGADPERGHVFTDRLLRARGREETLILGSEALRPMIRALLPKTEIVNRPRFSTLSFAGAKKLSRLPKRSAIVAFSAEEVYAVAETLRRLRGGAAVVMGALSPRTRNAQVAMFQAGEVDYLVATDAIGMGLNMDVAHVAFASLQKFDGRRTRRLTVAEMAQIAGRAGRHQRDGTFGSLHLDGPGAFAPEEIEAIENHQFAPLDFLYWRDGDPDMASLDALIASLEEKPDSPVLRPAPQAIDLAVLRRLADEDWVRARTRSPQAVKRLWAACGLPDFRKTGADHHARFVGRVYQHLSEGNGHVPHTWFAEEIARLDRTGGDVDTIADRIASIRSWSYIAHRADWLENPTHWAERTRAIEEKLSDALHAALTQRFVDRRTSVLLREIGAGLDQLPVAIAEDGTVTVDDEHIGRLDGFAFTPDASASHADARRLIAAADRRLAGERTARARALTASEDAAFALTTEAGKPPAIQWNGREIARFEPTRELLRPRLALERAAAALDQSSRDIIFARLHRWLEQRTEKLLDPLERLTAAAADPATSPALRALLAPLVEAGGFIDRRAVESVLVHLTREDRGQARKLGLTIGALDIFAPALLKPEPLRWRTVLLAVRTRAPMPALPPAGAVVLPGGPSQPGFRRIGRQQVRIDMVERIARAAHEAREGKRPFVPDPSLATSIGLEPATLTRLMLSLGFRALPAEAGALPAWRWQGRRRRKEERTPVNPNSPFAALAGLGR